jgi:hypothetical protein
MPLSMYLSCSGAASMTAAVASAVLLLPFVGADMKLDISVMYSFSDAVAELGSLTVIVTLGV